MPLFSSSQEGQEASFASFFPSQEGQEASFASFLLFYEVLTSFPLFSTVFHCFLLFDTQAAREASFNSFS